MRAGTCLAAVPPVEKEEVPRLDYLGGAPAGLGRIIRCATLADPSLRYPSVAHLLSDVRNYGITTAKSTSSPLLMFALYSPNGTYDNIFLANYSYININDQMTRIKGIASVTVFGAGQYAMRFWVKPDQLAKLNITIPEIVDAIQKQNTVNPSGQVGAEPAPPGQEYTYAIRSQGRLENPEEFEQICKRGLDLFHS